METKAYYKSLEQMNKAGKTKLCMDNIHHGLIDADKFNTHRWLGSSGLMAKTEGFILAVRNQRLFNRNIQANIILNNMFQHAGSMANIKKP